MGKNQFVPLYIPCRPFEGYKWFFATKAPTESLGDPAVLLGLVCRLNKIADGSIKYSGNEFKEVMQSLDKDIQTTVNLSSRVGARNLMRNSSQYWKTFGLIPDSADRSGTIVLTELAKEIADGRVSQIDFASATIINFKLPNTINYKKEEIRNWENNDLLIHPFKLILEVMRELRKIEQGWLTNEELYNVVVPMAGDKQKPSKIAEYVARYREYPDIIKCWPEQENRSNDIRFTGEYLRFLGNFGFLEKKPEESHGRDNTRYLFIDDISCQIDELLDGKWSENNGELLDMIRESGISNSVYSSAATRRNARPLQQQFRQGLLSTIPRCPVTGVDIPQVLQAAHIKPHAFGGPEDMRNGLPLRADIHCLFDAGLLAFQPVSGRFCKIELRNDRVVSNYREFLGKHIEMPEITDMDFVKWRYNNYLLGVAV